MIINETTKQDLDALQALWNTPEVMHYVGFPDGLGITQPEMLKWLEAIQKSKNAKHYSIYENGLYCGETFFSLNNVGQAIMDIKIHPDFWGKSVAAYGLSYALTQALFIHNATVAVVDPNPENARAIALYKKLGFKQTLEDPLVWHLNLESFIPNKSYLAQALSLKEIPEADFYRYWELSARDKWYAYLETNAPYFDEYEPETFESFHARMKRRKTTGIYWEQVLVGMVSHYWEDKRTRWLETGILLFDSVTWGKGIGSIAIEMNTQTCFDQYPEIERVGFVTWSGNIGMMHVGQKLGFKKEAQIRNARYYKEVYYDSIRYGITRTEWLDRHSILENTCVLYDKQLKEDRVRATLCDNPNHFGIPSSLEMYVTNTANAIVFSDTEANGVLSLIQTAPLFFEIDAMAVMLAAQGKGIGTLLVKRALLFAREHGAVGLIVKTLSPKHPDIHYAKTRHFYEKCGFIASQTFDTLWGVDNPAIEYLYIL